MLKNILAVVGVFSIGIYLGSWNKAAQRLNLGNYVKIKMVVDDNGTNVPTVVIDGANLQVVNGMGSTKETNGAGNLIIGYNETYEQIFEELPPGNPEPPYADERSGSHNLIMGRTQNYNASAYGNIVTGELNSVSFSNNTILSSFGAVSNGSFGSVVATEFGVILPGPKFAAIFGGKENATDVDFATIVGGQGNFISSPNAIYGTVAGGKNRTVFTPHAFGTAGGVNIMENN